MATACYGSANCFAWLSTDTYASRRFAKIAGGSVQCLATVLVIQLGAGRGADRPTSASDKSIVVNICYLR